MPAIAAAEHRAATAQSVAAVATTRPAGEPDRLDDATHHFADDREPTRLHANMARNREQAAANGRGAAPLHPGQRRGRETLPVPVSSSSKLRLQTAPPSGRYHRVGTDRARAYRRPDASWEAGRRPALLYRAMSSLGCPAPGADRPYAPMTTKWQTGAVDDSGIDLGMVGGKVRRSVNLRWISRKRLTRSRRRRKLSINRKRYGSNAKGEGSPQGSPEHLVRDPNRQRRGGRTSALRLASRGRHEGSGAGRAARFPVVGQEGEPPRG